MVYSLGNYGYDCVVNALIHFNVGLPNWCESSETSLCEK